MGGSRMSVAGLGLRSAALLGGGGLSTFEYVSHSYAEMGNQSSITTFNRPAGIANGAVLLVALSAGLADWSVTSGGFTAVPNSNNANPHFLFGKKITNIGSEPATYQFNRATSTGVGWGIMVAVSGGEMPNEANWRTGFASGATLVAPSVTTTKPCIVFRVMLSFNNLVAGVTPPAGDTLLWKNDNRGLMSSSTHPAGVVPTGTFSGTVSAGANVWTLAV